MSKSSFSIQTGNRLLDLLPKETHRRLSSSWETVPLPHGQELYKQNGPVSYIYFPTSGVCSIVNLTEDGKLVEAATIGNEGMVGISAFLGLDFSPCRAISQVSGKSLRMQAQSFLRSMEVGGPLDRLLRRYVAFSLRHAHQTIVCNVLHSIEERMCRWLLMTHDRVGKEEFILTQEFLSEMLGVRRQSVSVIAGTLQTAGFIRYRRGNMRIVNREGLEAASCECYAVTRSYYDRIVR